MKNQSQDTSSFNVRKTQRFMERTWLVIGIISLGTWVYVVIRDGFREGTMILIISGISFLMYYLRRYLRKNRPPGGTGRK